MSNGVWGRPAGPAGGSKMRSVRWQIAALVLSLAAFGCSTPDRRSAQERASDRAIAAQVEEVLTSKDDLYARHIEVEARRGVIWLSGWVLSADESRRAVQASAAVPGVRRVIDGMEIKDYFPH
jgi:osmotically-inducible protein OsmY